MVHLVWKTVQQFLESLNIELSYEPAISFLGIDSTEIKTYIHIRTSTQYS